MPFLLFLAIFMAGLTGQQQAAHAEEKAVAAKEENVFKGKVLGVSKKAKTISIDVKGKTELVKFDDATEGMAFAIKDEGAVINFRVEGNNKIATVIKQKLATLPEGVTEIQLEEFVALMAKGPEAGNFFLVDSRPGPRYHEGHIPSAVSIPVPKLKESGAANFPADLMTKDTVIIFYCGGVT